MRFEKLSDIIKDVEDRRDYEAEYLGQLIVCQLTGMMDDAGVTKAELAKRLGCHRSKVTKMFSVGANLTLRSVAAVLVALGSRLSVSIDRRYAGEDPLGVCPAGARTAGTAVPVPVQKSVFAMWRDGRQANMQGSAAWSFGPNTGASDTRQGLRNVS